MKKIILFIVIITTSFCSTVPKTPFDLMLSQKSIMSMEEMNKAYPYWNLKFDSFVVYDDKPYNPGDPDLPPNLLPIPDLVYIRAKKIDVLEKKLMLQKMDLIRFAVNTPEFASNLMKGVFKSARNVSGSFGTIKKDDVYDNKRILEILQKRIAPFSIHKKVLNYNAAAVAVVGPSVYVLDDNDPVNKRHSWVAFPNREYWGSGGYLNQPHYIAGVLFHELLHNAGFTHGTTEQKYDTVCSVMRVFRNTIGTSAWQKKYKKQLQSFRYYELHHTGMLALDTFPVPKSIRSDIEYYSDEEEIVCIINPDGTYKMVKMRNGRII